jgi:hypothetical protein
MTTNVSKGEAARSESQKKAEQVYGEKRKSKPRLPSVYLTEEENDLLMDVEKHFDTKKDAIIEGLKLLDKKLNK